jgi:senataxin
MCALNEKGGSLPDQSVQATVLRDACDTHAQIITRAAFTTPPNDNAREARIPAWTLLREIFLSDGKAVTKCLHQLCSFRDEQWALASGTHPSHFSKNLPSGKELSHDAPSSPLPSPVCIHKRVWGEAYQSMAKTDPDASALLLVATASTAHIDILLNESRMPFSSRPLKEHPDPRIREKFELTVKSINSALSSMREGFSKQVEGFAESCGRTSLRAFLAQPEIVKSLLHHLLSPVRSLNDGAEAIVVNAYDAVERSACFFALLERHPLDAFKGVTSYLKTFNEYVTVVPAACDVSKSLVRSLKEILDGLGEPNGLLSRPDYGRDAKLDLVYWLPELWRLMSGALAIIFQRTKFWAPYFPTPDMVVWMRDALIFGRDMESYVVTLQQAVRDRVTSRGEGKGKMGPVHLIPDLSQVLTQLIEWLKITDRETLHQTHELLTALLACFASSSSDPPRATVEILERYAERKKGTRTELSDEKLSELLTSLQPFLDDVRIIEPTPVAAKHRVFTGGMSTTLREYEKQKLADVKVVKSALKVTQSSSAKGAHGLTIRSAD